VSFSDLLSNPPLGLKAAHGLNGRGGHAAALLLAIVLGFFILYPPALLFVKSFEPGGSVIGSSGPALIKIFSNPSIWKALANSIRGSAGAALLATIIGGVLAWLEVKTDFPLKKSIRIIAVLTFIVPPYIYGLAWLQVWGRNGYAERLLRVFFQFDHYTVQYYSVGAVSVVMGLHLYPLMYMSLRNALKQQDRNLEKAAMLSGASTGNVIRTITLPLIIPSVYAAGLLVFSRTMANFSVPALLALPARKEFLTTLVYSSLSGLDLAGASAISLVLVALSTLLFWGQRAASDHKPVAFRTECGFSSARPFFALKERKPAVVLFFLLFTGLTTVIPLLSMGMSSFLKRWGLPLELEFFTLDNYRQLLMVNGKAAAAFRNSLMYGGTAAFFALLVGGGTAYVSQVSRARTAMIVESTAVWPMAFPNIVLAIAAILAWNRPPLRLYGTSWAIILTYMVLFIPIVTKQVSGLIRNHEKNLILAARLSGAAPLQSFLTITLPIISPGLRSGFVICILIALREIPISLMLYASGQETVGVLLFGMQSQTYGLEMTSALSMLIIVFLTAGHLLLQKGTTILTHEKASD
jgi:iron(III) transport system permease protein